MDKISTLESLFLAPRIQSVSLLMRHSERYPILDASMIFSAGLTPDGVRMAEGFGEEISPGRQHGRLCSSPIERCMDTANAISRGADWGVKAEAEERLSYQYPAWNNSLEWLNWESPPGMIDEVVWFLLGNDDIAGRLHLFVTHDTILNTMLYHFTGQTMDTQSWPGFLEGLALWRDADSIFLAWRGDVVDISARLNGRKRL